VEVLIQLCRVLVLSRKFGYGGKCSLHCMRLLFVMKNSSEIDDMSLMVSTFLSVNSFCLPVLQPPANSIVSPGVLW
jgi:hypothetical protein